MSALLPLRLPFNCREPGSSSLRWNGESILKEYCRNCEGLTKFMRCLRSDPYAVWHRLHRTRGGANKRCRRCQTPLPLSSLSNLCEECLAKGVRATQKYRESRLHKCSVPECEHMTGSVYCRSHAASFARKAREEAANGDGAHSAQVESELAKSMPSDIEPHNPASVSLPTEGSPDANSR